jgi:CubicO group peptidase (beta-lactamase class C family)
VRPCPILLLCAVALPALAAPPDDLTPLLEKSLAANPKLPSLCAVVIVDGAIKGGGASGVRKRGDETPVTLADKYHLGSCTKSFTATLAATLVEEGKLSWTSTLGDVLTREAGRSDFHAVTLEQLLTNTGGFPGEVPPDIWADAWNGKGSPARQRADFMKAMLALKPAYAPGTGYAYSNTGFTVAGMMLEKALGKDYEELVRQRIFVPLKMTSAGFGPPAVNARKVDQPWGHDAKGLPVAPGPRADNPEAIAPAGRIHCSLPDLASYVLMHLKGQTGPVLKHADSFTKLHTAPANDYAMGWIVAERPWAGGKALTHTGTNTMFTCVIWMAPEHGFAAIVATNIGHEIASKPCDETIAALIGKYLD